MNSALSKIVKKILYPAPKINSQKLKQKFKGQWVVITGASRGIGEALASRLINCGAKLILVARSEDKLKALYFKALENNCEVKISITDLRNREQLNAFCEALRQQPDVKYVFCNAGKSIHRKIMDSIDRMHDFDRTMDLNFKALTSIGLAVLPNLQKNHGKIIYTSSVSCLYPATPKWSAYHSSKCAANIWCQTVDNELKTQGVRVQIAYMPLVHTQMSDVTEIYRKMPAYSAEEAADILLKLSISDKRCYKPWWAWLTEVPAFCLSPIVRKIYNLIK